MPKSIVIKSRFSITSLHWGPRMHAKTTLTQLCDTPFPPMPMEITLDGHDIMLMLCGDERARELRSFEVELKITPISE